MNQGVIIQVPSPSNPHAQEKDSSDSYSYSTVEDETSSLTASTIVNEWELNDIANTLFEYGDVTKSRQIAREIVMNRPINSTGHLADVITRVTAWQQRPQTLARCFQALRIAVNDELNVLEAALDNMHNVIRPGGRLVILSYHSLEDRRVKNLFKFGNCEGKNMFPEARSRLSSAMVIPKIENDIWDLVLKKALAPTDEEVDQNKRSRSAKLRVAERIGAENTIVESSSSSDNVIITGDNDNNSRVKGVKKGKAMMGAKQLAKEAKRKALEAELEGKDDDEGDEGEVNNKEKNS